ncbi:MAR binding filament-like protein 1 isoform 1 [Dorcoceras hygrometricum]|uniref:MAR binding filament-like protein 1 isoform 1 n=1 Tax=Dorcoceras hygrometricum TaxID=472368 RepID=A0A2Z7CNG6_9LAMI|nr:MAR binding filament-like protein 1 isoform 1 [Dorcoceras hygrometricum]
MESAVMTSALMSSQSAVGYQQMKRSERDEATSCWRIRRWFSVDDVIGDVIIFSRWFERAVARTSSSRKLQWIQSQCKDFQTQCLCTQTQEDKSIVVEEDSGEEIDKLDASNSSIQSLGNPVVSYSIQSQESRCSEALQPGAKIQSQDTQSQYLKIQQRRKAIEECISSEAVEDLQELDVNC